VSDKAEKVSVPKKVSRRDFVNTLLYGSASGIAVAALYPVARFVEPPEVAESTTSVVVAAAADELNPNEWKTFPMGSTPGILIRKPNGDYVAFIGVCTHLDCTVQYREDLTQMWCPCHNGRFDLTGRNVAGPPPRPLEALTVNLRDNEVVVSRGTA
jgi:cytochrome b6-f complex iron-sulfur subunit